MPAVHLQENSKLISGHVAEKKGYLYFEINAQMGEAVVNMLRMMEFKNVELIQDLSGKDRFVKAQTWNR